MIGRKALSLILLICPLQAQSEPEWNKCSAIATLPADLNWAEPLEQRRRFQLRQCNGDPIVVTGFEKGKTEPSLVFDTGEGYPPYLAHTLSVLVFQSTGGASDHVYVFGFRDGKPSMMLQTATKGQIQVRRARRNVTVTVPIPTYPDSDRKAPASARKQYVFPIEY